MGTEIIGRNPDSTGISLRRYYGAFARQAWKDIRALPSHRFLFGQGALFLSGAIVFWLWKGWEETVSEIAVFLAFVLVPIGVFSLVACLYVVIRTPAKLNARERDLAERRIRLLVQEIEGLRQEKDSEAAQYRALAETRPSIYAELDRYGRDWIIKVENSGPTGIFSANMTVLDPPPNCRDEPDNNYQLFWERAGSTQAEITTGGGDWVKIACTELIGVLVAVFSLSLYRYDRSVGGALQFCNFAYIPNQTVKTVIPIQVVITASPAAVNGPHVFKYDVDHNGVRATVDD